jgi:hypothetical protein
MRTTAQPSADRQYIRSLPVRRESAALRLLATGELGAHLLHLAQGAACEHLAQTAQERPMQQSREDRST